jgi:hypothetical protein
MITEDLDLYLADFGEAFTLEGGAAGGVTAIFDAAYLEQLVVAGTRPVAQVKASAVLEADVGKTFTRVAGGQVYVIRGYEPIDDGAFVMLRLEAQ